MSKIYNSDFEDIIQNILDHEVTNIKTFKLVNNDLGVEQNLVEILNRKIVHSLAAISYFDKVKNLISSETISSDAIEAITLFELTQVDFADSIGELEYLRDTETLRQFYNSLMLTSINGKRSLMFSKTKLIPQHLNQEISKKLYHWEVFLSELCIKFFNIVSKGKKWDLVKPIIERRLTEYFNYIIWSHTRNKNKKKQIQSYILNLTNQDINEWKKRPDDIDDFMWVNFLGDSVSFLMPLFMVIEFPERSNPDIITSLIRSFRGVGLLNVYLDDLIDVEEDILKADANLYIHINRKELNIRDAFNFKSRYKNPNNYILDYITQLIKNDFTNEATKYPQYKDILKAHSIITNSMLNLYYYLGVNKKIDKKRLNILNRFRNIKHSI